MRTGHIDPQDLHEDQLNLAIAEYVCGLIPSDEQLTGLVSEALTMRHIDMALGPEESADHFVVMDEPWIAALTDKYLRFYQLDHIWEPSPAGYNYYEQRRREGRFRPLSTFETVLERHGMRYCYLPNAIDEIQIPLNYITEIDISLHKADRSMQVDLYYMYELKPENYMHFRIRTSPTMYRFNTIFRGMLDLVKHI